MLRIAHIINPVKVKPSSDLYYAQPVTFESMRIARKKAAPEIEIELYTTQYPEDHEVIPEYFTRLPDLQRSVLDVGTFKKPRKLPLIADIIDSLYRHTDAPYLIYTNADIGLMPAFYLRVKELIEEGHDALIINRRRIEDRYRSPQDLPAIYQDPGKPHPGFDCFVFHRDLFPHFRFRNICVGIPFIGVSFAHNLFCFARNLALIDDEHLTFHIGMQVLPKRRWESDYYWHNRREFNRIKKEYWWDKWDIRKFPYANLPVWKRYWKWLRNPSLFVLMNFKLEWRRWFGKYF